MLQERTQAHTAGVSQEKLRVAVLVSKAALQFIQGNCVPTGNATWIRHAFGIFTPGLLFF